MDFLFEEKSLVIASKKCTWFGVTRNLQMPARLMDLEVVSENQAIKILGAFIGDDSSVSERLIDSLRKHNDMFRRLKLMGTNNISCKLLAKCVNVRQNYHLRVHNPDASKALAKEFDQEIEHVLESWFGPISKEISSTSTTDQERRIRSN